MRMRLLGAAVAVLLSGCMFDSFRGPDGLITNEYAHWNPNAPDAVRSARWEMTSGSLFRRDGTRGRAGIRGDNSDFSFDNFRVRDL